MSRRKMSTKSVLSALLITSIALQRTSHASANESAHKQRSLERELSDQDHFGLDGNHNSAYDHEAFLGGEDSANEFDQLTPEESRSRLAAIVDKIDKNADGQVSEAELQDWIAQASKGYVLRDVDHQWKSHNPERKDKISWNDYKDLSYAFLERLEESATEATTDETQSKAEEAEIKTYKDMLRRDERRWKLADQDGDGHLSKNEFADFLHPEETAHMRDVVVQETLEDVDRDKDGRISLSEYVDDLYASDLQPGDQPLPSDNNELPEWVAREKEQFRTVRDRNGDGYLDNDEVREWIIPSDYDHSQTEARHLVQQADGDGDGALTKEEILDKYQLFVGSQATDYGEQLLNKRTHDEF